MGVGSGKFRCLNIPLKDGITDKLFTQVFNRVCKAVISVFRPSVIVFQCGLDGLAEDPLGAWNLTTRGIGECLSCILQYNNIIPLLLLGGGGYHPANVSRCWTYLTSLVARVQLADDIPEHNGLLRYKPYFKLHTHEVKSRKNTNSKSFLMSVLTYAKELLKRLGSDISTVDDNGAIGLSHSSVKRKRETENTQHVIVKKAKNKSSSDAPEHSESEEES